MNIIKEKRKNKKLTQAELAKKMGVSQPVINYWEIGRQKPLPKNIKKLKEIFNLTEKEILILIGVSDEE